MKMKKIISAIFIFAFIFCAFFAIPAHAKTTPQGYSEIAVISAKISGYTEYGMFNPVFIGGIALICSTDGVNYGYIDLTGKMIIPAEYTGSSGNFIGDYAFVDKSWQPGRYGPPAKGGLIDRKGKLVIPMEYNGIAHYNGNFFNEYGLAIAYNYRINEEYPSLWFEAGFDYGVIDKNNNIIIPFEYDYIGQFIDGYAKAMKNGKFLTLDIYGNEAFYDYNFIYQFDLEFINGYAVVFNKFNDNEFKYGLINKKYELILPCEYESVYNMHESFFIVTKDGKYSIINAVTGKKILDAAQGFDFDKNTGLITVNIGEPFWAQTDDGKYRHGKTKYGAINLKGETVIPFEYDLIYLFRDGVAPAIKNGKFGYIDAKNKTVVPFVSYDGDFIDVSDSGKRKAIIRGEKYYTVLDENNREIYRTYEYMLNHCGDFLAFCKRDPAGKDYDKGFINSTGKIYGVMDKNGKIIIPIGYHSVSITADKYFLCWNSGSSYSIYDLKGNKISKEIYSYVEYLEQDDRFKVSSDKNNATGIIDNKGNYVLPMDYSIYGDSFFNEKVSRICDVKTEKYGYMNSSYDIIVPPIFDYACTVSEDGYAIVKQGEQWKIIRIHEGIPAKKTGDVLGDVLYSDIVAYINGYAIPTSIINGKPLVAVEDLARYGFIVVWNNNSRTLRVQRDKTAIFKPLPVIKDTTHKPGTFKCKYLYTDIKTYLSGKVVESYAINGVTLIDFELLAKYGRIFWDDQAKELRLVTDWE